MRDRVSRRLLRAQVRQSVGAWRYDPVMGERRRRTMGERGAPPDPLNNGLYCRHCASKYCSCDGFGNTDSYWEDFYAEDDSAEEQGTYAPATDDSDDHDEAADNTEMPPEFEESEGWTLGDTLTVGAIVVGAGAAVAVAGPVIGISAVVAGFVGGSVLDRIFGK